MSDLYVCEEYEDMFSEGFKIVRTLEKHEKMIRKCIVKDLLAWMSERCWICGNKLYKDSEKESMGHEVDDEYKLKIEDFDEVF